MHTRFSGLNLANGDIGFNFNSIKDSITGGITAQFGAVNDTFKSVMTNLGNCGTMLDPTNLARTFTANGMAENLINQGFSEPVLGALEKVGINSVDELITANEALVTQALESIPADQVANIVKETGFIGEIDSLSDVFKKPETWLGDAVKDIAATGQELGTKFFNALGETPVVKSLAELGQTIGQITTAATPALDAANSDRNVWESYWADPAEVKPLVGSGSGIFGNPTIADVIGVAAGIGYTSRILNMSSSQQRLLTTTEGQALQTAINNAIANPSNDAANAAAISAAAAPFVNPTSPVISQEVAVLNENFNAVANKIITEKRNLQAAQIDITEDTGSLNSVLTFVGGLHSVHEDPKYLGYAEFIKEITTDDVYGEAIRAAIIEGKNLKLLESIGVTPQVTVDSQAYVEQVLSQQSADICCPPAS